MKLFEYCQRDNLLTLTDDQRRFITMKITREVKQAATAKGITEEEAYWQFSHGLIEGSDREID